jgi:alpha-L-fucosidase 2
VKVLNGKAATGENPNALNTMYTIPPYEKNKEAKLPEINSAKEYELDFMTEKGKVYEIRN